MSLTVTYKGKISRLESTATSAWVQVPQPDQTLTRFGATIEGVLNLRPGYDLPYELALFSLLRDAAVNNRNVEPPVDSSRYRYPAPRNSPGYAHPDTR